MCTTATAFLLGTCTPLICRPRRRMLLPLAASGTSGGGVGGSSSYLDMWRKAVERERRAVDFTRLAENTASAAPPAPAPQSQPDVAARTEQFNDLLSVPKSERDRVQRMQVIDRAAAAIAAAKSLLRETKALRSASDDASDDDTWIPSEPSEAASRNLLADAEKSRPPTVYDSDALDLRTPGPDFWSWSPPSDDGITLGDYAPVLQRDEKISYESTILVEKEPSNDTLALPLESSLENNHAPSLPPLQSFVDYESEDLKVADLTTAAEEANLLFSSKAAEAAEALNNTAVTTPHGVTSDGTKWWKETGTEKRADGVVCKWTVIRGYSASGSVEWEDKYWEASDHLDYKELGSEKSGRDAAGNVWREFWKESMWQDATSGFTHMEKAADKWGKSSNGDEWQEKWWERYDSSGFADKWAHKWCSIDKYKELDPGHAHVWHERWGENYDGKGGSTKYTDKWAERFEGDGWSKWGDKWDEHFNPNGHGVKQGETWWEGKYGGKWNKTWGEGHNGSGWVHKYGRSSCGEHWDTHEQQETWYERYPHFGFAHCFENSRQLRAVPKQDEQDERDDAAAAAAAA